jgi:hypothetical protein
VTRGPDLASRIQLSPGLSWSHRDGQIFVYGDEVLALRDVTPAMVAMMHALGAGTTMAQARLVGGPDADAVLDLFKQLAYIVPEPSRNWDGTPLDRQVSWLSAMGFDTHSAQQHLCDATVAILGLGGVGSVVLQHLIAAGVRRFALIDDDRIEASNFNRQPIYHPAQKGMSKVNGAAAYIARHAPGAQVASHACAVSDATDLTRLMNAAPDHWDCLVVAADRPADLIDRAVAPFCQATGIPALGCACGLRTARWGPLITGDAPPRHCATMTELPPPAPKAMAASFGPTNAIISSFLAKDVITLLAGGTPDCAKAVLVLDFANLSIKTVPIPDDAHAG